MNAFNKVIDGIEKGIYFFLSLMLIGILTLDILFQNIDYTYRKEFLLSNVILLIISLFACLTISILMRIKCHKECIERGNRFATINKASVLLFFILVYISLNIYFLTGWDAGYVIDNARALANGESVDATYFSQFSNQQLLLLVEALFFKMNNSFGVIDTEEGIILPIAFQCLLVVATGNLLYRIILDYTDNRYYAWLGWGVFCVLNSLTGWITIPYTDGMTIIYPLLILWGYQKKEQSSGYKRMIWWGFVAALSYWGFKMKPTVLIMFMAIVCIEFLYGIKDCSKEIVKKFVSALLLVVTVIICSSVLFQKAMDSSGVIINKELDCGALHMMMMGLKNEHDGGWDADDVALSVGIPTKQERHEVQINTIRQRLEEYGFEGLLRHTARKSLVIFNDGSFAWSLEGNFYTRVYDTKNNYISPMLRDLFYSTGTNYKKLATLEQALWLLSLLLCCFCIFVKKNKFITIIVTSLVGIILFSFIFEARARYLMIYVPIFIILEIISLEQICNHLITGYTGRLDSMER